MDPIQLEHARTARGFMPDEEGLALYDAVMTLGVEGPVLEVGSYCGKSAIYLGAAAQKAGRTLFSVDHHRGSEENQLGWEHHDADLVDPEVGQIDTLPWFRRALYEAGLEAVVVAIVGESSVISASWGTPLAMVFIDGGHGADIAATDYQCWAPIVTTGGFLAIHDVFEHSRDGGQAPHDQIYRPALASGQFEELMAVGSLRLLRRL